MTERLYRSRSDRVLAGVCGGLAEWLKVDPSLIRIAWVVLALATAVVPFVVLYIVMAVVVPERPVGAAPPSWGPVPPGPEAPGPGPGPQAPSGGQTRSEDLAVVFGALLVVVGLVFLVDRWFAIRIDWGLVWPAALVAVGLLLVLQGVRRPSV